MDGGGPPWRCAGGSGVVPQRPLKQLIKGDRFGPTHVPRDPGECFKAARVAGGERALVIEAQSQGLSLAR
eukprot:623847-Lingulodinium_polyedra.AAC.1